MTELSLPNADIQRSFSSRSISFHKRSCASDSTRTDYFTFPVYIYNTTPHEDTTYPTQPNTCLRNRRTRIWAAIFHWIVSFGNFCDYMAYITDFSSESFGMYVGIIYMKSRGVEELVNEFEVAGNASWYYSCLIAILYFGSDFGLQILGVAATVAISQTIAAIGFPVLIIALIPLSPFLMPGGFTRQELSVFDDPTANNKAVSASLGGQPARMNEYTEESGDEQSTGKEDEMTRLRSHEAVRQRAGSISRAPSHKTRSKTTENPKQAVA